MRAASVSQLTAVTSTTYRTGGGVFDPYSDGERFEYGLLMNAMQSFFSCLAASAYLLLRGRNAARGTGLLSALGLEALTPTGCAHAEKRRQTVTPARVEKGGAPGDRVREVERPPRGLARYVSPLLLQYLLISALQSTGSFLSLVSLRYLSYPAITLAKSSKLVPVLLMNVLLYRRKFAPYKYVVVALVTTGVWMFMALGHRGGKHSAQGNSSLGFALLAVHLTLDGATNSTQDEIFARYGTESVSGTQMMLVMNAISTAYMTVALLLPEGLLQGAIAHVRTVLGSLLHPHWIASLLLPDAQLLAPLGREPQFVAGAAFFARHPDALRDVLGYAVAGAAGQIAIFETLERFGSLTLVSITVTRKLFTMLLSILVYQHQLRALQWIGVFVVFAGLLIEMREKQRHARVVRAAKAQ